MVYLLMAFVVAVVGAVPLVLRGRKGLSAVIGVFMGILSWFILYFGAASTVMPFWGAFGIFVFVSLLVAAITDALSGADDGDSALSPIFIPVVVLFVLFVIRVVFTSGMMRATEYAAMVKELSIQSDVQWTVDVQPKNPAHMRMATAENATYQAAKVLGAAGAIGSQFELNNDAMTLQMVKGELTYVVPLDYSGFSVWLNASGVPGYIRVSGENPHQRPELVTLPQGKEMKYTLGAFFGNNLERYLRYNGYLSKGLAEFNFEIDDDLNPWWVATVYEPTIGWSAEKVTGVVIVDPATGATTFYPRGQVPSWVDRVMPDEFVKNYLDWSGSYSSGWLNSWWGKKNLTEAEDAILIYSDDGQPNWVTDITSTNTNDDSLIAMVYTNSRTGESRRYEVSGGGTTTAIIEAANKNQQVQFKHLHGTTPQIYNVFRVMTAVVPILNEAHAFSGVAMIPINDIQKVAFGQDQYQAMREFEKLISSGDTKMTVEGQQMTESVEGLVDRVGNETLAETGTTYYLHLAGHNHIFTAGAGASSKLPLTQVGDKVRIEYLESARDVIPIQKFDNLSLPISQSPVQTEVAQKTEERRQADEATDDARALAELAKHASPETLRKLREQLKTKKQ